VGGKIGKIGHFGHFCSLLSKNIWQTSKLNLHFAVFVFVWHKLLLVSFAL
jgi:hypothetical protein